MQKCPVCDRKIQDSSEVICPKCKFDRSTDYENYPTLQECISDKAETNSERKSKFQKEEESLKNGGQAKKKFEKNRQWVKVCYLIVPFAAVIFMGVFCIQIASYIKNDKSKESDNNLSGLEDSLLSYNMGDLNAKDADENIMTAENTDGSTKDSSEELKTVSKQEYWARAREIFYAIRRGEVKTDEDFFPHPLFREYVIENCDIDKDGILSRQELEAVTEIYLDGNQQRDDIADHMTKYSLKGIEYFENLTTLYCQGLGLSELNVSYNTALKVLCCNINGIKELDVRHNKELYDLSCSFNWIAELDISNNTELRYLDCSGNNLTTLNVKKNSKLIILNLTENQITNLDLTNNTELTDLYVGHNKMQELDLTHNQKLESLYCQENELTVLDLSNNPKCRKVRAHRDVDYNVKVIYADGTE